LRIRKDPGPEVGGGRRGGGSLAGSLARSSGTWDEENTGRDGQERVKEGKRRREWEERQREAIARE
jgi:hypothetical protein